MLEELFAFQDFYLDLHKRLPDVSKNRPNEHINLAQFEHLKMILPWISILVIQGQNIGNYTDIFVAIFGVNFDKIRLFILTITVEKLNSVMNSIICLFWGWFWFIFDEIDKIRFFNFDQLIVSIKKGQDKMKKVWFS